MKIKKKKKKKGKAVSGPWSKDNFKQNVL